METEARRDSSVHPSDQELLLLADGELPSSRGAQVREHLAACWTCRARSAEIESVIADFVRVHHGALDPKLPPAAGSRALLKARLAEAAAGAPQPAHLGWFESFFWRRSALAFAILVAIAIGAIFHYRGSRDVATLRPQFAAAPVPNRDLTPGAARPVSRAEICAAGYRDMNRTVPISVRQAVFQKYGMANARPGDFEVDYLITPELGGSDDIRNLWPEPYASDWDAHTKDELEDRLHQMVCEGKIDLPTAQREIAGDWISAYKKYFHTDRPLPGDSADRRKDVAAQPRRSPQIS